jgi:AIPR protein
MVAPECPSRVWRLAFAHLEIVPAGVVDSSGMATQVASRRRSRPNPLDLGSLRSELADLGERFPGLTDDELFVLWFLSAYLVDDEAVAAKAIAGASNDKGIDAVYIDHKARAAFVVQGKFRKEVGRKLESRADVASFASLGPTLWGEIHSYRDFCDGLDPLVRAKLDDARECIRRRDRYRLHLHYVTLGRSSADLQEEATRIARRSDGPTEFVLFNGKQVLGILRDYLDGVAPPVRSLDLPVETGGRIQSSGVVSRFDPASQIESWVFSMTGAEVGELFDTVGVRLFARNIRGFLGSTQINRAMEDTLRKRPQYFWYFNNGVTIVCDGAQKVQQKGREILRVENPQVINGQQTTRVLAAQAQLAPKASVLVRVIQVPRAIDSGSDRFDELVSRIVEATNWQNQIRASDLVANDRRQVLIEREFRKLGYQYLRKRQTKREARRAAGSRHRFLVKKEELAQAVAACKFDPAIVREGKEGLFEETHYVTIFDSSSADYYLSRYWLMRRVGHEARGYPEWAYAKWLVLHFLWSELGRDIDLKAPRFRAACERRQQTVELKALGTATRAVYSAALSFYRANRGGRGPRAIDVSTFFKRRNLDREFAKYWRSSQNRHRKKFNDAAHRFRRELARAAN